MRLHLDCSFTRIHDANIGITRVVRGLARGLPAAGAAGLEVHLAAFHPDGFKRVETLGAAHNAPDTRLRTPFWQRLYRLSGSTVLRGLIKSLVPTSWQATAFRWFNHLAFSRLTEGLPAADIRAGDIVVLGDAGWYYGVWGCAQRARASGARIATILYDLIPLTHPQFCAPVHRLLFEQWLLQALRHSDAFMCISEATRSDLAWYCTARGLRCPPAASFPLGGELPAAPAEAITRPELLALANGADFLLTVGSIEPRKNHALLLDALDQCRARGIRAPLVIVGRPVDGAQATLARIRQRAVPGGDVVFLADCRDSELDFLYRHARAVILPSLAEGYGLPLIEARQRGCEVIASRIPSFETIADNGVRLFDPGSAAELAGLIERGLASPRLAVQSRMPEQSWRESARHFIEGLSQSLPPAPFNQMVGDKGVELARPPVDGI